MGQGASGSLFGQLQPEPLSLYTVPGMSVAPWLLSVLQERPGDITSWHLPPEPLLVGTQELKRLHILS